MPELALPCAISQLKVLSEMDAGFGRIRLFRLYMTMLALFSRVCLLILWLAVGALLIFLLWRGLPALNGALIFGDTPPLKAITGQMPVWDGLWPAVAGTAALVVLTMLLALFPGVGCGIYLAEFAKGRTAAIIRLAMDMLAGTPSIVMGLFGFTLIVFLRQFFWPEANTSLLLAAGCLALLVLPVLVTTTCEAMEALPFKLRLTCMALGITRRQAALHVLLPVAWPGIGGGVLLALARAAEDTAVIMLTGAVANAGLPAGLGAKFEALPFAIFYTSAQYQSQEELARGFGAALILLGLSSLLAALAALVQKRLAKGRGDE